MFPRTVSGLKKEMIEMGINNAGFIIKGKLMPEQRMHALFICLDQKTKDLVIMDHAYFGKVTSSDPKMFMDKVNRMESPEVYTIGAPYSGHQNRKTYVKVPKIIPSIRKRDRKIN